MSEKRVLSSVIIIITKWPDLVVYAFKSNANVNNAGAINAQSLNNTGVVLITGYLLFIK